MANIGSYKCIQYYQNLTIFRFPISAQPLSHWPRLNNLIYVNSVNSYDFWWKMQTYSKCWCLTHTPSRPEPQKRYFLKVAISPHLVNKNISTNKMISQHSMILIWYVPWSVKQLVILLAGDKKKCCGFPVCEHIWAESFTRHKLQMGSGDLEQPITPAWPSDTFHLGK